MQGWIWLFAAIFLEVAGTASMKYSDGLSRFWPSAAMFALYTLSFTALALAIRTVELGIGYAVWAGLGTVLIAVLGVLLWQEAVTPLKLVSIALVVAGVIGLKLADSAAG
jgi:small multidrug resistance pump